jgi:hypothetical protein
MGKAGKSEFFNQKQRERGETIALNKNNLPASNNNNGAKGGKGDKGKKKKKCC